MAMSALWNVKKGGTATKEPVAEVQPQPAVPAQVKPAVPDQASQHLDLKVSIHRLLLDKINLSALEQLSRQQIEIEIKDIVLEILDDQGEVLNSRERQALIIEVLDELLGLGPLEPLLKDETITDILVNGPSIVFVERKGLLERVETRFQDDKHLLRIIQKIVSGVGRRIDESSPYVDARLPDGSRVNAIISPLAIDGSTVSIRKFAKQRIGMAKLVELGSVSPAMATVMEAISLSRRNVLISGGTGSGKTTMLNAMSSFIDSPRADRHDRGFG